ncbi:MAG: efflux transporter periplasmic adaptor subunit [Planctomycetaceae bacterium]|nr:efflux transporter periplasmic adaptor subunit [Planctomycetaceae bacterium]|tara:strand:+ start:3210 stop:4472 length:1263 start_codon:yes stop_codon:yes gene_type:complete
MVLQFFSKLSLALLLLCLYCQPSLAQKAQNVVVSQVQQLEFSGSQNSVGIVHASKTARVGAAVDGRIAEFLVEEGDIVKAGQPLVKLQTAILEFQLLGAKAELALREAELEELVAGTTKEELAASLANLRAAEAARKFSDWNFTRIEKLFQDGQVVSETEFQQAQANKQRDEQLYQAAASTHQINIRGPRAELITQARARVSSQTAVLNSFEEQLRRHTITSPFNGYVTIKHSEQGQWVTKGEVVVQIIKLDEVDIVVNVTADHVTKLELGDQVRIDIPHGSDELVFGDVFAIVPEADSQSRTFPVKIRVSNEDGKSGPVLKAGMLAKVELPVGEPKKMLMAPKDAIVLNGNKRTMFVVDSKTKAVSEVAVELGVSNGELIEVTGGIQAGQLVVIRGNERLKPGQIVAIVGGQNSTDEQD